MSSLIVSTQVAAAPTETFAVYTDLAAAPQRIPAITKLELLSDGPFGVGTRWRETRLMFKKEATEEMQVTAYDPPRSYTVEANSHGMLYQTLFEFIPQDGGTLVRWTFDGKAQTLGAKITAPLFGLLFRGVMRKCMQDDIDALRDVAQGGAAGHEAAAGS